MKITFAAALFLLLAAALFGQADDGQLIGSWNAVPAFLFKIANDDFLINNLREDEIRFIFKQDGRGVGHSLNGTEMEKTEFTWRVEGNKVVLTHSQEDYDAIFRIIDKNTIAMVETKPSGEARVMVFVRRNE